MTETPKGALDASGSKIAIVVSCFHEVVTGGLRRAAEECLDRHGCPAGDRTVVQVPGAWEVPQTAARLVRRGEFDAVLCLGALIRGETPHFDVLAGAVAGSLGQLALGAEVPVIFGILTTDTVDQALARAGSQAGNKGWEAALAAVEMINLYRRMS